MSPVISVEHLSKTYPSTSPMASLRASASGKSARANRHGQIGAPSESTRPFAVLASLGMLREGERPGPSRADLEAWRSKLRGEQIIMDTV